MATKKETDLSIIEEQRGLSSPIVYMPSHTRRIEVQVARELAKIEAMAEMTKEALHGMSEVERYADYKAATTAAAADFLARAAAANQGVLTAALQEARQERFEKYLRLMGQVANAANIKMMMSYNQATQELDKRTVVDALEEFNANVADALLERRTLPNGRR